MPVIRAWIPELYDASLLKLHHAGLTDHEIADRMHFSHLTVQEQRKRLGLKPNKRWVASAERVQDTPPPRNKPNPLELAETWVPGFDRHRMTLDGRSIKLPEIARKLNARLKANGREQLGPENWRV